MLQFESEGEWLVALPKRSKLLFLAVLSHELTIAGRGSYEVQTEGLAKPDQLRRVNEIQHRASACMRQLLTGESSASFEQSIASWVLAQGDPEFLHLTAHAWHAAKERLSREA